MRVGGTSPSTSTPVTATSTIDTPRPADERSTTCCGPAPWAAARSGSRRAGLGGRELSVVPSPKATTGTFHFATQWQLMQPMLTARATGRHDFRIAPTPDWRLARALRRAGVAGRGVRRRRDARRLRGLDAGKVALVTRQPGHRGRAGPAAKAAGAALLLVHDTEDKGLWATAFSRASPSTRSPSPPGAAAVGARHRPGPAARRGGRAGLDVRLSAGVPGPAGAEPAHVEVGTDDLATVRSDFREHSGCAQRAGSRPMPRSGRPGDGHRAQRPAGAHRVPVDG